MDLKGRRIVVVGAGGGLIGTAVCRLLAELGASISALDRSADALEPVRAMLESVPGEHQLLVADVSDPEETAAAMDQAAAAGGLAGMVHVVGGMALDWWDPLLRQSPAVFDEVVRFNLGTPMITACAMAERLEHGGSIVLISSVTGLGAFPFGGAYAAAKAGVMSMTKTAALEWGSRGIRVNAIAPGSVLPDAAEPPPGLVDVVPLKRAGTAADIAGSAAFLLSDLSSWITGQVLVVDGGMSVRPGYLDSDDLTPVMAGSQPIRDRLLP